MFIGIASKALRDGHTTAILVDMISKTNTRPSINVQHFAVTRPVALVILGREAIIHVLSRIHRIQQRLSSMEEFAVTYDLNHITQSVFIH